MKTRRDGVERGREMGMFSSEDEGEGWCRAETKGRDDVERRQKGRRVEMRGRDDVERGRVCACGVETRRRDLRRSYRVMMRGNASSEDERGVEEMMFGGRRGKTTNDLQ